MADLKAMRADLQDMRRVNKQIWAVLGNLIAARDLLANLRKAGE